MISTDDKINELYDWVSSLESSLNENETNIKNLNDKISLIECKIDLGKDSEKIINLEKTYDKIIEDKNKEIEELKFQVLKMINLMNKYVELKEKTLNDFELRNFVE